MDNKIINKAPLFKFKRGVILSKYSIENTEKII